MDFAGPTIEAGLLLGELGDNIRYEEKEFRVNGEPHSRRGLRLRAGHWVTIGRNGHEAAFRIGNDSGNAAERPAFSVALDAFQMAAYPVTCGEWRGFFENHGYDDPDAPWWRLAGPAAQQWLRSQIAAASADHSEVSPWVWRYPRLNNPLQPIVGITAHEALAFTYWVAALYEDWEVADGLTVALPTEVHWEAGVRGPDGRRGSNNRWPAVDSGLLVREDPHLLLFNHARSRLGRTSPVGVFSLSNTCSGVADAAGNAWEWCSNRETPNYRDAAEQRTADTPCSESEVEVQRPARGGGYNGPADSGRVSWRGFRTPGFVGTAIGMRLVRVRLRST